MLPLLKEKLPASVPEVEAVILGLEFWQAFKPHWASKEWGRVSKEKAS